LSGQASTHKEQPSQNDGVSLSVLENLALVRITPRTTLGPNFG